MCQALRAISTAFPGQVIFKGGTSLEKLRLVERFSEDLDLLVITEVTTVNQGKRTLREMCDVAAKALGAEVEDASSGGQLGTLHRRAYLTPRSPAHCAHAASADPERILLELVESGGRHPSGPVSVSSLFARHTGAGRLQIDDFVDLAPYEVSILHPGRTLLEKLLRVNNFCIDDAARQNPHGWPRIGRQFYDIWALLGDARTLQFLNNRQLAGEVLADCFTVSELFTPDQPLPSAVLASARRSTLRAAWHRSCAESTLRSPCPRCTTAQARHPPSMRCSIVSTPGPHRWTLSQHMPTEGVGAGLDSQERINDGLGVHHGRRFAPEGSPYSLTGPETPTAPHGPGVPEGMGRAGLAATSPPSTTDPRRFCSGPSTFSRGWSRGTLVRSARRVCRRSGADAVVQVDHAVVEPVLVDQLEIQPYVVRQRRRAAAHDHREEEQVQLVDQPGLERLARELGAADAEIAALASAFSARTAAGSNDRSSRVGWCSPRSGSPNRRSCRRPARSGRSPGCTTARRSSSHRCPRRASRRTSVARRR